MVSSSGGAGVSHAYYLRSSDQADGIALLDRSGVGGYVWPTAHGWVPLVSRGWARSRFLLDALPDGAVLLRYAVVPERGWSFELLSRDKCFLRYGRTADPALPPSCELLDENLPLLARLVAGREDGADLNADGAIAALRAVLFPGASASALSRFASAAPHRVFASLLGLSPSEGLFYDDLPSDIDKREIGVVRVSARSARSGRS